VAHQRKPFRVLVEAKPAALKQHLAAASQTSRFHRCRADRYQPFLQPTCCRRVSSLHLVFFAGYLRAPGGDDAARPMTKTEMRSASANQRPPCRARQQMVTSCAAPEAFTMRADSATAEAPSARPAAAMRPGSRGPPELLQVAAVAHGSGTPTQAHRRDRPGRRVTESPCAALSRREFALATHCTRRGTSGREATGSRARRDIVGGGGWLKSGSSQQERWVIGTRRANPSASGDRPAARDVKAARKTLPLEFGEFVVKGLPGAQRAISGLAGASWGRLRRGN